MITTTALNGFKSGPEYSLFWTKASKKNGHGRLWFMMDGLKTVAFEIDRKRMGVHKQRLKSPLNELHRCPRCRCPYTVLTVTGAPFFEMCPPCKNGMRCAEPRKHGRCCWCNFKDQDEGGS